MWKDGGFRELGNKSNPEFDRFVMVVVTDLVLYFAENIVAVVYCDSVFGLANSKENKFVAPWLYELYLVVSGHEGGF